MKLAISNLAWNPEEDAEIAKILAALKIPGVELAPTKSWPDLTTVTRSDAQIVRDIWKQRGVEICALQSLLFGQPTLSIFGDLATRNQTLKFLKNVIQIAGWLSAPALVFGSPKNRLRGPLTAHEVNSLAVSFFKELGDYAAECGTNFCIEPNPSVYGCDFILTAEQGAELVAAVESPGFGLHLDSAGMYLSGENGVLSIEKYFKYIRHFHISAPQLAAVDATSPVGYGELIRKLADCGYAGWVSIEMKQNPAGGNVEPVRRALEYVQSIQSK